MRPPWLPPHYGNSFWRFLSNPDEHVSLKLFVDNFRNYAIAAALIFAGSTLQQGVLSKWRYGAGLFLLVIGYVLTVLSALQLFVVSLTAAHTFLPLDPRQSGWKASVAIVLTGFLPIALAGSVIWFVYALVEHARRP